MSKFSDLFKNISIRSKIVSLILLIYCCLFAVTFYYFGSFVNKVESDLGEKLVKQQVTITKERTLNYFAVDLGLIEAGLVNKSYQAWFKHPENEAYKAVAIESISAVCEITDCHGWFFYSHKSLQGLDWQKGRDKPEESKIVLERDTWYTNIIATGKTFFTDASVHPLNKRPYIYFDYFVREEGELIGLLGTYVDTEPSIAKILNHSSEQVSNVLIDNNGFVRGFSEEKNEKEHRQLIKLVKDKSWQQLVDAETFANLSKLRQQDLSEQPIITHRVSLETGEYLAALMYIEELEWYSLSLLDKDILSRKIDTLPFLVVSAIVLIFVIVLTVYLLNTQLFSPILSIHQGIKNISSGQYKQKVEVIHNDELGTLAMGINQMTEELSSNLSKIQEQNQALNEAMDLANRANKAKSLFLSNMSHELRTPMNAVLGFTQIGVDANSEQEKDDCLNKIHQAGEHLLLIINDILDFNKIEANELSLEQNPFIFTELVQSVLQICHLKAKEKGLTLKIELDSSIPPNLVGDALRLKQVLINLLNNAIKFTESGDVTLHCELVEASEHKVSIKCKVIDTGIGMSKQQLARLFKPFTQADESVTRKYGGTGLGLAISAQLVELMQGKISVKSEEGNGAEFSFTAVFTRQKERVEHVVKQAKPVNLQALVGLTQGLQALLVEDNQINQIVAGKLLEPLNMHLDFAEDGLLALGKTKKKVYDIIFMDVHMPYLDGIGATKLIRQHDSEVLIIGLSADVNAADVDKALQAGMNDYVTKPIIQQTLFNTVYKHLSERKQQ